MAVPRARPKVIPHLLMPGETITGAIKKYNLYDVSKDEMTGLLRTFNTTNTANVFRPGNRVMVPILERHQEAVFNLPQPSKNSDSTSI